MKRAVRVAVMLGVATFGSVATAQTLPPVHPLGPVLATSTEPLASVSQARALPGGRVMINDLTGRRVLVFDSTLKTFTVIADSTSATASAYHSNLGSTIAYRGDSTLFYDPLLVAMLLIDPNGKIVRTMAPPSGDARALIGGPFGTPAPDAKGRLVYRLAIRPQRASTPGVRPTQPDSALIVRYDLERRTLDTVVKFGIPEVRMNVFTMPVNGRTITVSGVAVNPIPWTDDWAVLADGTIAVVRGREFRIDFIGADDKVTATQKFPFDWQHLTDDDKTKLLDSAKSAIERQRAAALAARIAPAPDRMISPPVQLAEINEVPDYRPAFQQGGVRADADGHLWIRTSMMPNGGAVCYVISRTGALIDRIQLPPGRVVAGFGPGGVVYMGVVDGNITRLERARFVIAQR